MPGGFGAGAGEIMMAERLVADGEFHARKHARRNAFANDSIGGKKSKV
jgi:hypothetical protein